MSPPDNPAGEYVANANSTPAERDAGIDAIANLPRDLRAALAGLTDEEINDTVYKNWTIRQIVHHLGDSHASMMVRVKLALTEESPRISPYDPGAFAALADSRELPVAVALSLLDAIHARVAHVLRAAPDFTRGYFHPEYGRVVTLNEAVGNYAWHGRHHVGQILWLRQHRLGK